MPNHHPHAELLLRYASGELTEPQALVVASHMTFCAECRIAVSEAESIGGALLDDCDAETQAAASLERQLDLTLARAARQQAMGTGRHDDRGSDRIFPGPLRNYVSGHDRVAWKPLGPGIQHLIVARHSDGSVARLLKIAPGRAVFEHGHRGTELTLVLAGAYRSAGTRFVRGDVESADESTLHRPIADPDTTCICLAATDAPLQFRNLLGRIIQPFLGV